MFITSRGGLTAGRVDADGSLFPTRRRTSCTTGTTTPRPATRLRVRRGGTELLWHPFGEGTPEDVRVERNLYKNVLATAWVFEEIRHDLGLGFRYRWSGSDEWGFVRTSRSW